MWEQMDPSLVGWELVAEVARLHAAAAEERERCARVCERLAVDARNAAARVESDALFEQLDGQRRVLLFAMRQIKGGG